MEMNQISSATAATVPLIRTLVRVEGIVQGVGFRPFVFALATRLRLAGWVANDRRGVAIEVEGAESAVAEFITRISGEGPPLARVERITTARIAVMGEREFRIIDSRDEGTRQTLIAPDTATCPDCLREIFDPTERRYRYPFTNCTNCGPRFTIVCDTPYDRPSTTMAGFEMCPRCAREYHNPTDRRFHAQPISCPDCGPRLVLIDREGREVAGDPVALAARLLASGRIIAVKGLGGYHLAASAADNAAVSTLRARKHREDKPFAVMVYDLAAAARLAIIEDDEARVMIGPRRPIVLLRRRPEAALAEAVAPSNRYIGLMLPYTPLHHLLCEQFDAPIVLTSGNVSDEPIAYEDDDARRRLGTTADFFLVHDRPIYIRTDDSVVRVFGGREMPIRRSRGYAPQPLTLPSEACRPILACGAELKNTFCVARGRRAFLSHHIGDLENYQSLRAFSEGIEHFCRLFDIRPQVVAHDLHPEYLSTKYALDLRGVELIAVQHHHAHIASCLADNLEQGPVIGVAFDGLGYGADGTLWGGEFLIADLRGFTRVASIEPVPMPGGAAAIRQPWRMALSYIEAIGYEREGLAVYRRNRGSWGGVAAALAARVNSPMTSSAGRLFDAVASLAGVRDQVNYEGQAAVEFEQMADVFERGAYSASLTNSETIRISGTDLVQAAIEDLRIGTPREIVAARFHNGMAQMIADVCIAIRDQRGFATVALSGGVFQNALLFERACARLTELGFRVITHSRVPPNDGGIAFGQAAIAAAQDGESIRAM